MEPHHTNPVSSSNHRFPEMWQGVDIIPSETGANDQIVTNTVAFPTSTMTSFPNIASSPRWQVFEEEGIWDTVAQHGFEPEMIIDNRDNDRITDLKQRAVEFLQSSIGVALLAAIAIGIALLIIRPAFIVRKDDKRKINFSRLVIWMLIVFAIVGLRDQIVGFHQKVVMPMKDNATSAWNYIMPPRT